MKHAKILFCLFIALSLAIPRSIHAQSYASLWKKVAQLRDKDLPQSAAKQAHKIYTLASQRNDDGQMIAALLTEMSLQSDISPDSAQTALDRMEHLLAVKHQAPTRSLLHLVLGHLYQLQNSYLQENAQTRAYSHLQASMSDPDLLANAHATDYLPLIIRGSDSKYYHDDLLSIVAPLAARYLNTLSDQHLNGNDEACRVMHQEIDLYRRQGNREAQLLALLDSADICQRGDRSWLWQRPIQSPTIAKAAPQSLAQWLQGLTSTYGDLELCATVYTKLAQLGTPAEQWQWAQRGLEKYPKSKFARTLHNRIRQLSQPSLSIHSGTRSLYPGLTDTLAVEGVNLQQAKVRFYRLPFSASDPRFIRLVPADYAKYTKEPAQEVSVVLPKGQPYETVRAKITYTAPDNGLYLVQAESDKVKSDYVLCHVSCLRLMAFTLPDDQIRVWVTDAQSGTPISGASIKVVSRQENDRTVQTHETDDEGKVILRGLSPRYYTLYTSTPTDAALGGLSHWYGQVGRTTYKERLQSKLALFTDRAIYRPGQKVQVGGFLYEKRDDAVRIKAHESVTLKLMDANYKQIAETSVETDDYGAVSAQFTLPTSCLNGQFTVQSDNGSVGLRVEEYKRPTFQVTFDEVKSGYKAGDTVTVNGQVKTLSGFPLSHIRVAVSVTRRNSPWAYYFSQANMTMSQDTLTTDGDGRFEVPVVLTLPTPTHEEITYRWSRYCIFRIQAVVTTDDGETEENEYSLFAGDHAVQLFANWPDRVCKEHLPALQVDQRNAAYLPVEGRGECQIQSNGQTIRQEAIDFNKPLSQSLLSGLPSGQYEITIRPQGSADTAVWIKRQMVFFSLSDAQPVGAEPLQVYVSSPTFKTGEAVQILLGSPRQNAYIFRDRYEGGRLVESRLLHLNCQNLLDTLSYKEAYGNGIQLLYVMVCDGKVLQKRVQITKSEPDKRLTMRWSTFRSRLTAGQQEEWRLQVLKDGKPAEASVLATLYDAALDKFAPLNWPFGLNFSRYLPWIPFLYQESTPWQVSLTAPLRLEDVYSLAFSHLDETLLQPSYMLSDFETRPLKLGARHMVLMSKASVNKSTLAEPAAESVAAGDEAADEQTASRTAAQAARAKAASNQTTDESVIGQVRTDFSETAFFMPRLKTDARGNVSLAFTLPQSLTTWKFRALAHTTGVDYGRLDTTVTASKDFMVQPNMPRFLRAGDQGLLAVSVRNAGDETQQGTLTLQIIEPQSRRILDKQALHFDVKGHADATYSFRLNASGEYPLLICRVVGKGRKFTDGEEHYLPVLEDKEEVHESLPLTLNGKTKTSIDLSPLWQGSTGTKSHQRLTVEYTAHPAWLALEALPYMVPTRPYDALSNAVAYYALTLSSLEAKAHPQIRQLVARWKQTQSVDSVYLLLERNPELKQIVLSETPWVGAADAERERCLRLAELFDSTTLSYKLQSCIDRLTSLQSADGGWCWYQGMPTHKGITIEVAEILARLHQLAPQAGLPRLDQALTHAIDYLHKETAREVAEMKAAERKHEQPASVSVDQLRYLYICALQDLKPDATRSYLLDRLAKSATRYDMYAKSLAARVLSSYHRRQAAQTTLQSLMEHTAFRPDMGRYFDTQRAPSFYESYRIPTQVAALETLDQLAPQDSATINEMVSWLLQAKRTETWDNPVSSVEAVHYLYCKYHALDAANDGVKISLLYPNRQEVIVNAQHPSDSDPLASLGYYKRTLALEGRKSTPSGLRIERSGTGLSYGAAHLQYTAPAADIRKSASGISLIVKYLVSDGGKWVPVQTQTKLKVGEKLKIRLELTADRDYDFVSVRLGRAACAEPVRTLSGYSWQDGCYREVDDASTQYFYQQMSKGKHVIEDEYRLDRSGTYHTAVPTAQCVYAPEFNGRGEGLTLTIAAN